jgi:plastocyanin
VPSARAQRLAEQRKRRTRRVLIVTGLGVIGLIAVSALAGWIGDDSAGLPAVEGPTSPALDVTATEFAYDPDAVAVAAGSFDIVLRNEGAVFHDLRIEGQAVIVEAGAGDTSTVQASLGAGRYRFFCSIPGHVEAGMEGVLEVR